VVAGRVFQGARSQQPLHHSVFRDVFGELGHVMKYRVRQFFPCSRGGNGQAFEALQGSVLVSCTRPSREGMTQPVKLGKPPTIRRLAPLMGGGQTLPPDAYPVIVRGESVGACFCFPTATPRLSFGKGLRSSPLRSTCLNRLVNRGRRLGRASAGYRCTHTAWDWLSACHWIALRTPRLPVAISAG
jgi:hypothetical protein